MSDSQVNVHNIIEKIRTLPSAELSELEVFVDFLRFKTLQSSTPEVSASLHLLDLSGALAGYDTSPESLAELRRELWHQIQ
jgi:hypothetical protein